MRTILFLFECFLCKVVKAGLLLALFGGVRRYSDDPEHVPVRGDPHVLVVGDPGLGKSQLLQACARVAPRGVFVCGNMASIAGLTVSVARGSAGGASLEAGALVLADRGEEHCAKPNCQW